MSFYMESKIALALKPTQGTDRILFGIIVQHVLRNVSMKITLKPCSEITEKADISIERLLVLCVYGNMCSQCVLVPNVHSYVGS